jgi:membrane-bound lytic murein transglycosylase D
MALTALLTLVGAGPTLALDGGRRSTDSPFPAPAALEPDIEFWVQIYSEVSTSGGLIHDTRDLSLIYEVAVYPAGVSRRGKERYTEKRKKVYSNILRSLSRGKRSKLSADEARVLAMFPEEVSNKTLRTASSRVRFQLGQADKFRDGLIRSGAYTDHIRRTLHEMNLPEEIASLPHVESSYTPHAYSRVGAAGLWQFTRSTGRRFMRVDHVVDERLDPYRASIAAARLLEQNYRVTGSWPLAITAYNHGASGMRRAIRKHGTKDITTIVRKYRSRTFGFASRNFYVEFLAANRVASDPERYFGPLRFDEPTDYDRVELPFYATPGDLAKAFDVDVKTLQTANPALRSSVWQGQKRIPKGFEVKLPRGLLARPMHVALADVPSSARHASQTRDSYHVVRRGETLSVIARRYGVRMSELQALNGLRSRHRIRIGQKLRLPSDHAGSRVARRSIEPIAPPADGLYTVRRGDSIAKIAQRFGMSESDLLAVNTLRNRNRIYPGQVLRVSTAADKALLASNGGERMRATSATTPARAEASGAGNDAHPQALALFSPARSAEPELIVEDPLDDAPADANGEIALVAPAAEADGETDRSAAQVGLLADPSDYSVASDGTIEIQASETLGHIAEWLGIRASRLRSINHLSYRDPLTVHERLQLDFSRATPEQFEQLRSDYHRAIQEDFFSEWEISGTKTHRMRRGDSIWVLSHRRFRVPLWLLRQYNPDLDFAMLGAGTEITVPLLKERSGDTTGQPALALTPAG